jgi:hypothetical protein
VIKLASSLHFEGVLGDAVGAVVGAGLAAGTLGALAAERDLRAAIEGRGGA